ncbi:cytochrome c oxidase assembly factor Coa1 family protein [Flavobacteriaceae bacterium S356]|uniref:Cytochrome c oxidase assembly factor Coa1 family protein n=1 Tax=Asprobacillus argus TaxID=3076534 RepID=A0ABU3LCQ5_9FLAO|nr:cytochrome c oxidase assembly factor Coa1 family protein [Flavobacteriaceae bacterium S356]
MEHHVKKSWFRRNWTWFVPTMGCGTIIILFILGIVGIFSLISGSEPTQHGLEKASNDPQVIKFLGEPIEKYGLPTGEMTYNSDSGSRIDFIVPIEGPKGKGSLIVKGYKENETWVYQKLYVHIKETNEKINLLDKSLEGI